MIALQRRLLDELRSRPGQYRSAEQLAEAIGAPEEAETAFKVLHRLAANPGRGVVMKAAAPIVASLFAGA